MPKEKKYHWILLVSALALIFGFIAGLAGQIVAKYYLSSFSFFRDISLVDSEGLSQKDIIITQPKKVVVEQDIQIDKIMAEVSPSVVGVYANKKNTGINYLDKIFTAKDWLGSGFILTSDGWIVAANAPLAKLKASDISVVYDGQTRSAKEIISDKSAGIAFIKIDSQNLPVINLAKREALTNGMQVLISNYLTQQIKQTRLEKLNYWPIQDKNDYLISSENYNERLLLSESLSADFIGSPLISQSGQIIGLVVDSGDKINTALAINYVKSIMESVLSGQKISPIYLGLDYLDLSQTAGLPPEMNQNQKIGALLLAAPKADSPLINQLQSGDIITEIENQRLSRDLSLMDIILQYRAGDQIKFKYIRDGVEKEATLTLEKP